MPLLSTTFHTLPDLFNTVFTHYRGRTDKAALARKIEGKYDGISHDSLLHDAQAFAAYLKSIGIEAGDRVAILAENRPAWVAADIAILSIGAVVVPLYPSLPPNQISYILQNAECKAAVVSTALQLSKIKKILFEAPTLTHLVSMNVLDKPDASVIDLEAAKQIGRDTLAKFPQTLNSIVIHEDDLATLVYTSGTTGNPKGVMLTHRNICENVKSCNAAFCIPYGVGEKDSVLSFLPLSHMYERTAGYYVMFGCGVTISYAESIETVSLNLTEVKPTIVITVPRLFERIKSTIFKNADAAEGLKRKIFRWAIEVGARAKSAGRRKPFVSPLLTLQAAVADRLVFSKIRERFGGEIRFFISGGAALPKETGEFFESIGIKILEGFGLTETSPVTNVNRLDFIKYGTVGPAIPGVTIRIAADGEILIKGDNVMKGYWRDEAATLEVLRDGWLYTGDIGEIDRDGYLKITDRKKHIIVNSGGKNIAPLPIENLLAANRYVEQAVVLGERRPFLVAVIVPNFESLKSYAAENGIITASDKELAARPEVRQLYEKLLKDISRSLASYEKVRKFMLAESPFSIERGEMTPTLKIKRKVVEEKYKDEIEALYSGLVYEAD